MGYKFIFNLRPVLMVVNVPPKAISVPFCVQERMENKFVQCFQFFKQMNKFG